MLDITIKSGVYKILNTKNRKVYVGSAIDLNRRRIRHFSQLKHNCHHNQYLQRAYNKFGKSAFKFEIIEYVEKKLLVEREQYWMNKTLCYNKQYGYNMCLQADSSLGVKHTEETITKMRLAQKNKPVEIRDKISKALKGNTLSVTTRLKISNANKGRVVNEQTRRKISEANRGRILSDETKHKISNSLKGRKLSDEHRANIAKVVQNMSSETRGKISHTLKTRYKQQKKEIQQKSPQLFLLELE